MDDENIIELYFSRNESAIKETSLKYGALCFEVANNILNSRPDSEECVSDTYLGVWNAIPPTRPQCFRAFILRLTRNISLSRLRRNLAKKRSRSVEISLTELEAVLPDESLRPDMGGEELGWTVNEFLKQLDPDSRNIFLRKYWFFDSVAEIASRFSFSQSKVKSSLFHTREKLKKYLLERGVRI